MAKNVKINSVVCAEVPQVSIPLAKEANGTEPWACAGSYSGSMLDNAQDTMARTVARGITDYEQLILRGK